MAIGFNLDEIFEMAEQIEKNGANFYREAAKKVSDRKTRDMFISLAGMEDGHFKIFQEMRKQLDASGKEPTSFDPDNEAAFYLQAMAASHGVEGKKDRTTKFTGKETIKEVFETAVNAEKLSIVFYSGLKKFVSSDGKGKIDAIISEEFNHLSILYMQLEKMP
ncbi:MAG: ferritin family protein [Sedimentisphaerales bacterium]|jgi:rubrerythrin